MMNIDINKDIMSMLGTRFIENKHNIDTNIDNLSMIFMKRLDDLEAKRERDAEFTGEKYTSRFKGKFQIPGSNESINKILNPPLELQTQFAQIVEKTETLKIQYQQSLQELENLDGSLSQKAFRGKLSLNKTVGV